MTERISNSPVFILSIFPRSGTNYLLFALGFSPRLFYAEPVLEDYFLFHAGLLAKFARKTANLWLRIGFLDGNAGPDPDIWEKNLLTSLGRGTLSFLEQMSPPGRRIVTKTPFSRNLKYLFKLYPSAQVIFLVRDGRDVVQSFNLTWPRFTFAYTALNWRYHAWLYQRFLDSARGTPEEKQIHRVSYEDLVSKPRQSMSEILRFLNVEERTFDWAGFDSLDLIGSSVHRGTDTQVHWKRIPKPKAFNPIGRWKNWGLIKKLTFRLLAGSQLKRLGYLWTP